MKRISLLAVLALLFAQQSFAGPWIKSLAQAQKQAKTKNQLIFVDMFADWCGWCHRMEQEVFPSEAFQKATDDMVLLRLNTEDGADGTKLAQQYGISTLPTFVVLTPDMMIAGIIRGYAPSNEFVKILDERRDEYKAFVTRAGDEAKLGDPAKRLALAKEYRTRYGLTQSESRLRKLLTEQKLPNDVRDEAYYELAVSQLLQKKYADAQKTVLAFSKLQNSGESYERSRLLLGQSYVEQGNYLAAVTEFRNFKKNFPTSPLLRNVEVILPQLERQLANPAPAATTTTTTTAPANKQ